MQPDLQEPLYKTLRRARIAAGLTQSALAERAGCRQSAVSMMEAGRTTALSQETLRKIAGELGVTLPDALPAAALAPASAIATALGAAWCPNFQCLSNLPYFIGEELFFLPLGTAGDGAHCLLCGELLERACPACGARVHHASGCCEACGRPLVAMPEGFADAPRAWADAQREQIALLRAARSV